MILHLFNFINESAVSLRLYLFSFFTLPPWERMMRCAFVECMYEVHIRARFFMNEIYEWMYKEEGEGRKIDTLKWDGEFIHKNLFVRKCIHKSAFMCRDFVELYNKLRIFFLHSRLHFKSGGGWNWKKGANGIWYYEEIRSFIHILCPIFILSLFFFVVHMKIKYEWSRLYGTHKKWIHNRCNFHKNLIFK